MRGLEVGAYDPAPTSEAFTRRFIDKAWPTLEKLKTVKAGVDPKRIEFFNEPSGCRFSPL